MTALCHKGCGGRTIPAEPQECAQIQQAQRSTGSEEKGEHNPWLWAGALRGESKPRFTQYGSGHPPAEEPRAGAGAAPGTELHTGHAAPAAPLPTPAPELCRALPRCARAPATLPCPGTVLTPRGEGAPLHAWHGGQQQTEAQHGSCQGKLVHFTTAEQLLCSRNILFPWATSYVSLGTCRSIKLTSRSR